MHQVKRKRIDSGHVRTVTAWRNPSERNTNITASTKNTNIHQWRRRNTDTSTDTSIKSADTEIPPGWRLGTSRTQMK